MTTILFSLRRRACKRLLLIPTVRQLEIRKRSPKRFQKHIPSGQILSVDDLNTTVPDDCVRRGHPARNWAALSNSDCQSKTRKTLSDYRKEFFAQPIVEYRPYPPALDPNNLYHYLPEKYQHYGGSTEFGDLIGWGNSPEAAKEKASKFGIDVRNADGLIVVSDFRTGFWAFRMDGFNGWNGHQWGMPNISSAQDWDNGPEGAPKAGKIS